MSLLVCCVNGAKLNEVLESNDIEMIAPRRRIATSAKLRTAVACNAMNGAGFWHRFFTWGQWQRRLLVRGENYTEFFLGLLHLAAVTVLLK